MQVVAIGHNRLDRRETLSYYAAMFGRMNKSVVVLAVLAGPAALTAAASPVAPVPVQCTATGTKFFVPALSPDQACQHFVRAYGRASGTAVVVRPALPNANGIIIELSFRAPGLASARVTQVRAGKSHVLPPRELAVSDRKFLSSDLDTLAADVARGIKGGNARTGRK